MLTHTYWQAWNHQIWRMTPKRQRLRLRLGPFKQRFFNHTKPFFFFFSEQSCYMLKDLLGWIHMSKEKFQKSKHEAAEIPESLWREPPTTAATTAAPVTTKAPTEARWELEEVQKSKTKVTYIGELVGFTLESTQSSARFSLDVSNRWNPTSFSYIFYLPS